MGVVLNAMAAELEPVVFSSFLANALDLPRLPVELQDEIISHCDVGTLALASRVSFGFLQMASPRLYRDVEIVGPEQLRLLFCESVSFLVCSDLSEEP